MKKQTRVIILSIPFLLLCSCGDSTSINSTTTTTSTVTTSEEVLSSITSVTSESHPSTSDGSSIIPVSSITPLGFDGNDIANFLSQAASIKNYTFEYSYVDANETVYNYEDVYTTSYIYYSYIDEGYMEFNDPSTDNESLLYHYSVNESSYGVYEGLSYTSNGEEIPVRKTEELNPLTVVFGEDGKNINSSVFANNQDHYYYTRDTNVITALAYLLGVESSIGYIADVKFDMNEDKTELSFIFDPTFYEGSESVDGLGGTLTKIGTSSNSKSETLLSSFSIPTEALSTAASASLASGNLALNSLVTSTEINGEGKTIETSCYNAKRYFNESLYEEEIVNPNNTKEKNYYSKGTDGYAYKNYIGYDNTVKFDKTDALFNETYSNSTFSLIASAFRKTGSNKYTYYGYNSRAIVNKLFGYDIGKAKKITVTTSGDKIVSIEANSTDRTFSGSLFHYDATLNVIESKVITTPSSFDRGDYGVLGMLFQQYFDPSWSYLKTFMTTAYNANDKTHYTKTYYTDNTILFIEHTDDTTPGATEMIDVVSGYRKLDDGNIVPFYVDENNIARANDESIQGEIRTLAGWKINANLFKNGEDTKDGDRTYVINEGVDNIAQAVIGGSRKDYMIPSTYKVTTVGTSYNIKSIQYDYNIYGALLGTEVIDFTEGDSVVIPSEIDFSKLSNWVKPTNWEMGAEEVYTQMVTALGKDMADAIPYLYDREINDHWFADVTSLTVSIYNDTYQMNYADGAPYMEKYVELLKEKGYVLGSNGYYVKDGISIHCGNTLMGGIKILIPNA